MKMTKYARLNRLFFAFAMLACPILLNAQDTDSKPSKTVAALEKLQQEFVEHVEKEKEIRDKYQDLESKLKRTENELQRINAQGMQQQMAALQSAMQSMQANANLQILASRNNNGNNSGNNNSGNNVIRDFAQMQLMQNRFLQNLDNAMRANQLQQLDTNAQAVVRSRIQTMQDVVKLEQQWMQWQQESLQFYSRYWPNSDPEKRFSPKELEAALAALEKRHDKDIAAKLAAVNLLANSGQLPEALVLADEVLDLQTQLQGVAMMQKAKILALLDKDKESKQAMQAAIKLDKENPYVRWVRAEIANMQNQDAIAETELRFLTTQKPFEIVARRSLALAYSERSKKSPGEGKRAIKEATLAMELETIPDWYSHFVLATAYAAGRDIDSAKESIAKAEALADDEQRERCETLKASLGPIE
jgi:predicted Zn-dependent protease